jgi:hypothetical protein
LQVGFADPVARVGYRLHGWRELHRGPPDDRVRRPGGSIKKFVRTARRYRTVQIRAGHHFLTAEDSLPPDLHDALALIK